MPESIDDHVVRRLREWPARPDIRTSLPDPEAVLAYFQAQLQSRHLDLAARWLHSAGPGVLHDRLGGARGQRRRGRGAPRRRPRAPALPLGRLLRGARAPGRRARPGRRRAPRRPASSDEPIAAAPQGLRPPASSPPQTSTIASHLPRAVGVALAMDAPHLEVAPPWPPTPSSCALRRRLREPLDRRGAINAAALAHRASRCRSCSSARTTASASAPRTPHGWIAALTRPARPRLRAGTGSIRPSSSDAARLAAGCAPSSGRPSCTCAPSLHGSRGLRRRDRLPLAPRDRRRPRPRPAARAPPDCWSRRRADAEEVRSAATRTMRAR